MDPDFLLLDDLTHTSRQRDSQVVPDHQSNVQCYRVVDLPQFNIDTGIRFVLLFHILECEVIRLGLTHLSSSSQLLSQRDEFVVVSSVVE